MVGVAGERPVETCVDVLPKLALSLHESAKGGWQKREREKEKCQGRCQVTKKNEEILPVQCAVQCSGGAQQRLLCTSKLALWCAGECTPLNARSQEKALAVQLENCEEKNNGLVSEKKSDKKKRITTTYIHNTDAGKTKTRDQGEEARQ